MLINDPPAEDGRSAVNAPDLASSSPPQPSYSSSADVVIRALREVIKPVAAAVADDALEALYREREARAAASAGGGRPPPVLPTREEFRNTAFNLSGGKHHERYDAALTGLVA